MPTPKSGSQRRAYPGHRPRYLSKVASQPCYENRTCRGIRIFLIDLPFLQPKPSPFIGDIVLPSPPKRLHHVTPGSVFRPRTAPVLPAPIYPPNQPAYMTYLTKVGGG